MLSNSSLIFEYFVLLALLPIGTFSTDTPPLFFEMEGVQEVSLALGHDESVSVGCPLYNEASAVKGCLVLSSNVIVQRLDGYR